MNSRAPRYAAVWPCAPGSLWLPSYSLLLSPPRLRLLPDRLLSSWAVYGRSALRRTAVPGAELVIDRQDVFFEQVDAVLDHLETYSKQSRIQGADYAWRDRSLVAIQELREPANRWRNLSDAVEPYPDEVLKYVIRLLRAREGLITRRVTTLLGSSRGAGLLGVVIAGFAVSTLFTFLKALFPAVLSGVWLGLFVALFIGVIILGWSALLAVHPANHLLYMADILEAVMIRREYQKPTIAEQADMREPVTS